MMVAEVRYSQSPPIENVEFPLRLQGADAHLKIRYEP